MEQKSAEILIYQVPYDTMCYDIIQYDWYSMMWYDIINYDMNFGQRKWILDDKHHN